MWNRVFIALGICSWLSLANVSGQQMNNATLYGILDSVTDSLEGEEGLWQIEYNDRIMLVITDENHDRMRIISPVEAVSLVSSAQMEDVMLANFHSVLDVRYAISDEILWAAFLHPLRSLSEDQVRDALLQVYRAAETYGTTYSSTELVFPGPSGMAKQKQVGKKKL